MRTIEVLIFLGLVLAFAFAIEPLNLAFGPIRPFVIAGMWSVAVAAMLALKLTGQSLSSLGWSWGPASYHVVAMLLPLLYGGLAYGGAAMANLIDFATPGLQAAYVESIGLRNLPSALGFAVAVLTMGTIGMIGSMSTALGEEIGWRGFLTPRLTAMVGFMAGTLVTGLIWSSWRLPAIMLSSYNAGGDIRSEIASFTIVAIALSGVLAWLRLASGSLWPAATLHASHNLFIQGVFDPLTRRVLNDIGMARDIPMAGDITMVGQFGVVTAAAALLVCIPFWIMGARMPRETAAAQSDLPAPRSQARGAGGRGGRKPRKRSPPAQSAQCGDSSPTGGEKD